MSGNIVLGNINLSQYQPYQLQKADNMIEYIKNGDLDLLHIIKALSNIEDIYLNQSVYQFSLERNRLKFSDSIKVYVEFVELIAKLIKEIGIPNNSISFSIIISKLIHDGYLSKNSIFISTEDLERLIDIRGFHGLDIINGYGCCRHVSSIHQDLFHQLNLCGEKIYCLKGIGEEPNASLRNPFNEEADHVVNLLEYDGMYYIHDVLCRRFYQFNDGFTMKRYPYGDNVFEKLYYKPLLDMIFNNSSQDDVLNKILTFQECSKESYMTANEFNEIVDETNNEYNKKKDILDDFKQISQGYTKKIMAQTGIIM